MLSPLFHLGLDPGGHSRGIEHGWVVHADDLLVQCVHPRPCLVLVGDGDPVLGASDGLPGDARIRGPGREFDRGQGAVPELELEKVLGDLLADEARREQLGRNALKVVHENLGAIERTVDMIVERLADSDLYIVPKRQNEA